jgi:uncharacterized membrane protein YfcA
MEIMGYIASVFVGVSLGLIGGGGSILVVPILIYLFHIDVVMATAYSLFVVGSSSTIGAFTNYRKGLVDVKTGVVFGLPAIASVYLTRKFLLPAIPEKIAQFGTFALDKNLALLLLFAVVMIVAAAAMIKKPKVATEEEKETEQVFNYPLILVEGVLVGVLTGLIGAGGGFIIIPALVLLSKLPMKKAVGTSLMIIAAKSLLGFLGDVSNYSIDWPFLLSIAGLAVVGIFIGIQLANFIPGKKLKPAFGWFVLVMGVYIISKELFFK